MKTVKAIFLGLLLAIPLSATGQISNPSIIPVSIAPSGACGEGLPNRQVISTGIQYSCQNGTWAAIGGGGGDISGTVSATHLTMGTGTNTVGDSPATYADGLFKLPTDVSGDQAVLVGVDPTTFTNWSELAWTSFVGTVAKSDNATDAFPSTLGVFYQINDQNAVGIDNDPSATGVTGEIDWIRDNEFPGLAEAIGAIGQVYVHGNGTTDAGRAFGQSGQVFVDASVMEATATYALTYFNLSGAGTPSVTNMNGLRTELAVGGPGAVGTYTGVNIGTDFGFSTDGATVQHSRGLFIDSITNGVIDSYQIYSAGLSPSFFAGPLQAATLLPAAARKGTFVCTNGGTITIANANEAATSDVIISLHTQGGTITTPPAMKTVTAATGFTVLCGATDTSTYNYDILN